MPNVSSGKKICLQCKRLRRHRFDPWVRKIPWRRTWQPIPLLLTGKSHEERSLVGYSPWDCKELDMTECKHTFIKASCNCGGAGFVWVSLVSLDWEL